MKKFLKIFLLAVLVISVNTMIGQSTSPRWGTTAGTDNTGRVTTYGLVSVTDAAGADSVVARPKWSHTVYKVAMLDSFTFKQPVVTSCYYGDEITIIATSTTGTPKLKFTGSNWITAGTATMSTGLRAIITLFFDGAKWVEKSRVVQ